ncbi:MAG: THUMP domain-containing class I SAM-dependent RNA methyltransferase [Thermodesulfobacteriota bacterium]
MSGEEALAKRIKRHLTGRVRTFFAATAPGLEKLCFDELTAPPLSIKHARAIAGGVEFRGRLTDAWLANLHLRTANRVLMRITEFRARGFPELERRLSEIPWELYLCPGTPPEMSVSVARSRLYHKGAVAERFAVGIGKRFQALGGGVPSGPAGEISQRLFIRALEDRFTVSIDSSGELLHKRGWKPDVGRAPMRETLAAAALVLAGYDGREPLIDPMCGAGTFSLEAALMASATPPGLRRDFAFMGWPSFRPHRWGHLRREAADRSLPHPPAPSIHASDRTPEAAEALQTAVETAGLADFVRVTRRDFFHIKPEEVADGPGLVVLNPPYGVRMGSRVESQALFEAICEHLGSRFRGWRFAMIAPGREIARNLPFPAERHPLFHGGLRLALLIGRV